MASYSLFPQSFQQNLGKVENQKGVYMLYNRLYEEEEKEGKRVCRKGK